MTDKDRQAVARAERRLAGAHRRLDLATIAELLHDLYIIVQPGGEIETKKDVLASLRTGNRRWDVAEVDQITVRLVEGTAIVTGRWRAVGRHGSEPFDYVARFLSVWVRAGGTWRNVAYQGSPIAHT